jgi:hypothetical protein
MTINHDDKRTQRLFDAELQAQRMGIPAPNIDDFDYLVGIERAAIRNPDELHQLASRFTPGDDGRLTTDLTPAQLAQIDARTLEKAKVLAAINRDLAAIVDPDAVPPAYDPAAERSIERERARVLRNVAAWARARRDEPSSRS